MFRALSWILAIISGLASFATPASAQTCEQELARQDAALRQLEGDARREGLDFVLDDVRRHALGEVSKRLKGDPTADAAREINARWEEYQAYVNQGRTFRTVTEQLSLCLRGGKSGCMAEIGRSVQRHVEARDLAVRIGEAVQKWIESLATEAMSRALDRVDRARGILENFTNRAAGTATEAAAHGITNCLSDFDRRVQQAQNTPAPVDVRQPPAVSAPARGGLSGGTMAAIGAGLAGGVGAVILGMNAINEANNTAGGGGSANEPSQIRLVGNPTIQCSRVGGLQSRCAGAITLDVGNVLSAGTEVCIRTDPSAFMACQVRGASDQLMFQIDERIINTDANGNITGCRPTQTGIFVYRGPATGVAATARVNANIPVTCS